MQFNKQQAQDSYIKNILVDGAKSFHYRGGIRSLLGIPEGEGKGLTSTSNFPLVGFKYENVMLTDGSYIKQYSLNENSNSILNNEHNNTLKKSQGILPKNIHHNEPEKEIEIEIRDSSRENQANAAEIRYNKILAMYSNKERDTVQKIKEDKISVKPPESLSIDFERTNMKIPGVSKKKLQFSALTTSKKSDVLSNSLNENGHSISNNEHNSTLKKSQGVLQKNIHHNEPEKEIEIRDSSRENRTNPGEISYNKILAMYSDRERDTVQKKNDGKISGKPPESSSIDLERTNMKIPGVSKKEQQSSALSMSKKSDVLSKSLNNNSNSISNNEHNSNREKSQGVFQKNIHYNEPEEEKGIEIPDSFRENQTNATEISYNKILAMYSDKERDTVEKKNQKTTISSSAQEKGLFKDNHIKSPSTMGVKESVINMNRTMKYEMKSDKKFKTTQSTSPIFSAKEKKEEMDDYKTYSTFQPVGIDTVNKSNKSAFNKIEQIRHSLQELSFKVSSQQTRVNKKTKQDQTEHALPPQTQQLIVIKHPINKPRIPCAFWERSYLSRFHLRSLR